MQNMTLEQLRTAANAGGITGVTLKGQGEGFFVEIAMHSGHDAILSKARTTEPRCFGNPTSALNLLLDVGIAVAQLDITHWEPGKKNTNKSRKDRAQAMREAHQAAAYNKWLASEIERSMNDPRPDVSHDDVMARMNARIAQYQENREK